MLLEQPNVPVFNYVDDAEEYGYTESVKFYKQDDELPYAKSDQPEVREEGIVLIKGWCI